jgi:CheY-like chemotaxis protein
MDGWQFLERLKTHPQLTEIPVVMISIVAETERGLALGAAQVLQKPLRQEELSSALAACGLTTGRVGRVLVVDDDPRAVDLIALLLESAGHTVLRAYGGAEGITIARNQRPDMIVLDLMMPEVSGFDVVEALKQTPETAQTPILIMTAKRLSAEERAELNGCIVKIVEKAELDRLGFLNEVRRALAARRQAEAD